jgi:hypothetical protein
LAQGFTCRGAPTCGKLEYERTRPPKAWKANAMVLASTAPSGGRGRITKRVTDGLAKPLLTPIMLSDSGIGLGGAHAGRAVVVLLGDRRVRVMENRAGEVRGAAAVNGSRRSGSRTEEMRVDLHADT